MPEENYNVFVYGTLKAGFCNHFLLEGMPYRQASLEGFEMYEGPGFPYAVPGDGTIYGEVYTIDRETLITLDALEGYPHHYTRDVFEVRILNTGPIRTVDAWVYYLDTDYCSLEPIPDGIWR